MLALVMAMADSPEDKRKVEKLFHKYNRLMFSIAYKILKQNEDAEDAVFDSWEKIIKHIDKIDEIECNKTRNFIVTIVKRISINSYNAKKRRHNVALEDIENSSLFALTDPYLKRAETNLWINSLPPKYRDMLYFYYIQEMSYKEIAEIMSIPIGTVASQIMRGRDMLKKEWEK